MRQFASYKKFRKWKWKVSHRALFCFSSRISSSSYFTAWCLLTEFLVRILGGAGAGCIGWYSHNWIDRGRDKGGGGNGGGGVFLRLKFHCVLSPKSLRLYLLIPSYLQEKLVSYSFIITRGTSNYNLFEKKERRVVFVLQKYIALWARTE